MFCPNQMHKGVRSTLATSFLFNVVVVLVPAAYPRAIGHARERWAFDILRLLAILQANTRITNQNEKQPVI